MSVENIRSAVAAQWLVKDNPLPVVVEEVEPDITTAEAKDVAEASPPMPSRETSRSRPFPARTPTPPSRAET